MLTIREYANSRNVSYEAVRRSIKQYDKELRTEIIKQGRTRYLSDVAVEFLDSHRQNKISKQVLLSDKDEIISNLKNEIIQLQAKIMELQEYKQQALENSIRLELASENTARLQAELDRYKPTIFGLYKRTK